MRYVAAYLLAGMGNNVHPVAKDLEVILNSVGVEIDRDRLNLVINELKEKKIEDVLSEGMEKLCVASAGIGGQQKIESGAGAAASNEPAATKEEPPKEETDESDDDLGFGLFD